MNEQATQTILEAFLTGGFDSLETLLTDSFSHVAGDPSDLEEGTLKEILGTHTVAMQASIHGGGTATYLFTMEDITKIVSKSTSKEAVASDTLDEAGMESLREIADGVLNGGAENLSGKFGEEVGIDNLDVKICTPDESGDLLTFIGEGPVHASFTFIAAPDFDGTGHFFISSAFEARVPSASEEPLVSDDEMKDILSGFSPEDESASYTGSNEIVPENLEVILGIDLTATARLGKIEMPISEILNIGPGSIIEVGHLVDDPVELLVNGRLIARGDIVVVDEKFGLRITEIVSAKERIESLR